VNAETTPIGGELAAARGASQDPQNHGVDIAPNVSAARWRTLKLDSLRSPDWATACDILHGRITERFIEPIDFLIQTDEAKLPTERRFGFAILALDCLLVETLGAFIDGLEDTRGKSEPTFCRFLMKRPQFASVFASETLAKQFYIEFRCGILHQAEVGGASRVLSVGPLVEFDGKGIIVNRTEFHLRLKAEFRSYVDELRGGTDATLRTNFRRKMDFISRN
jgi:hypothetical protein